ncbi:vWA domain-containing protein [Angustibacter sp. McL0619]|uniref:vWA domain-containing protein n=1 Tax=Angustibacter sp. McL0619 TaxID=3415676 RepID=UPI003CF86F99
MSTLTTSPPAPEPDELVRLLVGFARRLREAELAVGSGDVLTYCAAAAALNPADLVDVYWAGRTTLVIRRDQIPVYDSVFRSYFLDEADDEPPKPFSVKAKQQAQSVLQVPESEPGEQRREDQQALLGLIASDASSLKAKSFAACTAEELLALRHIMKSLRLTPPRRRTRRTVRASSGRVPDLRRTVRETMRLHGEPTELYWRRRRLRLRPLVLILDVSGSMSDYSRALLQFAYSTSRVPTRVEVFCFGTRLTRITRELDHRRPDEALDRAARAVVDWEGGTRIGSSLDTFVRDWARRGRCRGAIVVICSDGLDRGDPAVLATAMDRLSRLCHRIVWMNPHKGESEDFRPNTLGMMVAAPHIDLLMSGHDLRSLEQFASVLPDLR